MARLSGFHLEGGIGKTMLDLVHPVNSLYLTVARRTPPPSWRFVGEADGRRARVRRNERLRLRRSDGRLQEDKRRPDAVAHPFGNKVYHEHFERECAGQCQLRHVRSCGGRAFHVRRMDERNRGGRTTTRSTSPSTSGRGRRSAGGFPWLRSSFAKARRSRSTARSLSARAYSARTTRTPSGRARRGIGMERAITSSRRATPTRSTIRTAPTRTCSQSTRCRAIIISFLRSRTAATSPHGAGSGILRRRPAAGGRTAESQIPAARRGAQQHAALARRVHVEAHRVASSGGGLHG